MSDVSEIGDDGALYVALWGGAYGDKGGLAAFDITDPWNIHELSHVFNEEMYKANRVKIQGDFVFMPLELEDGGGVAVVDRTNPIFGDQKSGEDSRGFEFLCESDNKLIFERSPGESESPAV